MEELAKIRELLEEVVLLLRAQVQEESPGEVPEYGFGKIIGRTLDGTPVYIDEEWLSLEGACYSAKQKQKGI